MSIVFILVSVAIWIINLIIFVLIVQAVLSWLIAFELVSRRNQFIETIWRLTNALTDPMLRPIRRFMPRVSGVDFSPMVLILLLYVLQRVLIMAVTGAL